MLGAQALADAAVPGGAGWDELLRTLTFRMSSTRSLVVGGGTLFGIAAGFVGVFALLRKRSLVTDALSHATLPGICLAFLGATALGMEGRSLPVLLLGAAVTGVAGVVCIQLLIRHTRLHEDASIGIVLSVFFGMGVVGLSYIQSPGNVSVSSAGLNQFIYGQAAAMQAGDVRLMAGIAIGAAVVGVLFLKEFALVCFNDSFAKADGWPVSLIVMLMMALLVLVTVAGLQAVGLILVVAMLIIPPVAARFWTDRLWLLVVFSGVLGGLSGYLGATASAMLDDRPAGPMIVLSAGAIFVVGLVCAPARGVIAALVRRAWLRVRIAGDHLLEAAYEQPSPALSREAIRGIARARGWRRGIRRFVLFALRRRGMLGTIAGGGVELTEAGMRRGAEVSRNHALWEQYLISYADVAPSHVDWSVDQVEHVLSPELVAELERQLAARGIETPATHGAGVA